MIYNYNHKTKQWEETSHVSSNCWVSPHGDVFNCTAHEVYAEYIWLLVLQKEEHSMYGDRLIKLGWVKFTTSCMNDIYKTNGLYNNLTNEQFEIYEKYFDF